MERLHEYFLTQDNKLVAKLCACFLVDLNRFLSFSELTTEARKNLLDRTRSNLLQVYEFLETQKSTDLKIIDEDFNPNSDITKT